MMAKDGMVSSNGISGMPPSSPLARDAIVPPTWLATMSVIVAWYLSNIGVLLLNKFLLSSTGFRNPVFLTLCHMLACSVLGGIIAAAGIMPLKPIRSSAQLVKVCVLAVIFCLTIVLGNASLKFIPVSFNQAIGATTPFFTAIMAFILQGSRESALTYAALAPIAAGVVVASGGEPLFHTLGFALALMATAGRAFKSVMQSMLMTDPGDKLDPLSLLLYMSAMCVALLAPAVLLLEPHAPAQAIGMLTTYPGFGWWLLGNSTLAYFVNLTNFLVTKYTSALTLQVLGNAKGVVAAGVSVLIFTNPVTAQGAIGYAITVLGVFLYSESKRRGRQDKATLHPKSPAPGSESEGLLETGWGASRRDGDGLKGRGGLKDDSRV